MDQVSGREGNSNDRGQYNIGGNHWQSTIDDNN